MGRLSVVIPTLNEEENIGECLESVKWADEIIVVDMFSSDRTIEICHQYTDKIYQNNDNRVLNVNVNLGFKKATGDWILYLDADERVSLELKEAILEIVRSGSVYDGYYILFKHHFLGKWIRYGGAYPSYIKRFFRRGKGKFPCRIVHESLVIDGKIGYLNKPIMHYSHETIDGFISKINLYTSQEAETKFKLGQRVSIFAIISAPLKNFFKRYFLQCGFIDGIHGLVRSVLMALYSFLWRAKLWELHQKNRHTAGITLKKFCDR